MDMDTEIQSTPTTRCGFVALVGAPNAGKSTLMNALIGQKVSIVTHKPQTTRRRTLGLLTLGGSQVIFLDTPGIFKPKRALDRAMVAHAMQGLEHGEIVAVVVDVARYRDDVLAPLLAALSTHQTPSILVLNKIDTVPSARLLAVAADLNARVTFQKTFMISALKGHGVDDLRAYLADHVAEGPWHYPEDQLSDQSDRDVAAEIIRERLFLRLHEELPYHLSVVPELWKDLADGSVRFEATIYVARESHRMIVLGEKGAQIKAIGSAARLELGRIYGRPFHVFLHVKVERQWTDNERLFKKVGLDFSET